MNQTTQASCVYLEPDMEAVRQLLTRKISGPVVMLNLVRFRPIADYSQHPEQAPAQPITGQQAFQRYIQHTLPLLRASGGDMMFYGEGGHFLIGPADERWDRCHADQTGKHCDLFVVRQQCGHH